MPAWLFLGFAGLIGFSELTVKEGEQWKHSLHGEAKLDSTYYFEPLGPTNQLLETGRLSFDSSFKRGKEWKIQFAPLFQADPLNDSPNERYWAELPEAYLQYQDNGFRIQAGYNTFSWGVSDGYNPLDVVSARRYQDPLNQEKLGAPSLSMKKDFDNVSFELIYIPVQRKSILPGVNSRWLPREVLTTTSIGNGTQSATLNLPPQLAYQYREDQVRDRALNNNYGVRMQVNGLAEGLDVSIEGFEGAATTPAVDVGASGTLTQIQPNFIIQADPEITLTPVYYRQRVYGATFVYAAFGTIFKFETAFTRLVSSGADLLGNSEAFILGVERPLPIGTRDLTLVLQATHVNHSSPLTNSATSLDRIFDRALLLGMRYPASEKLTLLATGLWDLQFHEELGHLEASYHLTDAWTTALAGDALFGPKDTPLGSYHRNERLMLSFKNSF